MVNAALGRAAVGPELEPYRARIERYVRSLVRNRTEAEDLTQEALLRAHEQLGQLRDVSALGVWLYKIATRVCYDHLRKARFEANGEVPRAELDEERPEERIPAGGPDAEWFADNAAMSTCGERLLDTLPDQYRAVLLLHDMQGLTSVEIATLLACTPGSVKIRLHRARQRFREALERECQFYRDERGVLLGCPKPRRS
jgi:RNA polymerase sigma-70 factor (ECF subfamily)